jgi:hypothetical protein
MDGNLGNLSGRMYELDYARNVAGRVGLWYRAKGPIVLADYPPISEAYDNGTLSDSDWNDLMRIDVAAIGRPRHGRPGVPEGDTVVLVEVSIVVDTDDVDRAARRAEIVRKANVPAAACVDGDVILPEARSLAKDRGVNVLVDRVRWPGV